jgi:hypothetical protein
VQSQQLTVFQSLKLLLGLDPSLFGVKLAPLKMIGFRNKIFLEYRGGIYDQQDATDSQYLLLELLYMFRAIIAHHQELGTLCAAVGCIPGMVFRWWYGPVCSGVRI